MARGQRSPPGALRGTDRNQMWLAHRVAAINLRQLIRRGLDHIEGVWA